jgi:RNA polymerase sigma-70 factor, ECF subfamily
MGLPGSRRVVERLVEEHYGALYRYAFRLSGSATDAEDLTQATFCKAQSCWSQLREVGRAKAWLFSILRNAYLQHARERRQEPALSLDDLAEVAGPRPEPLPEVGPEQLQKALGELPEGFRTPVILFYFEEFSYRDIAEQLDLPIGTVMSRLSRAKAFLREKLVENPSPGPSPKRGGEKPLPPASGMEGSVSSQTRVQGVSLEA